MFNGCFEANEGQREIVVAFFEKCYGFEKLGPWSDLKESYEKAVTVCDQFGRVTEYYSRLETVSSIQLLDKAIDMLGDLLGCLELKMNLEFEETVLEDPFDYAAEDALVAGWRRALDALPDVEWAREPGVGMAYSGPGGRPRSQERFE